MKYDPIMCMMVDDSVKTKDRDPYAYEEIKKDIQMMKSGKASYITKNELIGRISHSFNNRTPQSGGITKEQKTELMNLVMSSKDKRTIDKAIRSCDATSVSSAKSGLKSKIDNWYRNAKIDYGVSGKFIDVREESGALVVYWEEDGKRKKYSFGKYWDDYSVEQLYNIWMEQAD